MRVRLGLRASSSKKVDGPVFRAGKAQRVFQRRAFDDFVGTLIVAGQAGPYIQVCAVPDQKAYDRQPPIVELRNRMEDRSLPADSPSIGLNAHIHGRSEFQQQTRRIVGTSVIDLPGT